MCLALVILTGCTGSIAHLHPFDGMRPVHCARSDAADALELRYLGAGGVLMRWNGHAILTAPFYSNPGLLQVGMGLPISPNAERIDAHLPAIDDVEAILVGHSHYDHLMDAVYVAEATAPSAMPADIAFRDSAELRDVMFTSTLRIDRSVNWPASESRAAGVRA